MPTQPLPNAHLLALHRVSGQLLWEAEIADYRTNYGATSAPLIAKDLVISGISGGDQGVRGFLAAYKVSTGERVWRFWTVPAPGEPGSETWSPQGLQHSCASTWLTGTYDPDLNLLYWPTGNPCPDFNGDHRSGDDLYSDSVLALDPDTGKLKWYFQFTPHDVHDWDATETPVLIDSEFQGRLRHGATSTALVLGTDGNYYGATVSGGATSRWYSLPDYAARRVDCAAQFQQE